MECIKAILVKPGNIAVITEVENTLESFQKILEGNIEPFYPFEDDGNAVILCNEEGKLGGSEPNRAVYGKDNCILDIIFGTFLICGAGDEDFVSLTDSQQEKYMQLFKYPQHFYRVDGDLIAVPFVPNKES